MRSIPLANGKTRPGEEPANGQPVAKILAVDDNAANLVALASMLADLGQPVVCARSGEEALRHLLKDDFAVILLDVVMPGMDGYETASMIRAREKSRYVPIIFLSAMNKEPTHLVRAYAAGAVDFVFKPIDELILRSKVAVFVELQKRAEEIRRQAALEKRLLADNLLVRSEQRRTEEALQRSLVQQSLVIESLPVVLYVASAADGFRTRRLIGGRLETLIGSAIDASTEPFGWLDRVHPADLPRILEAVEHQSPGAPPFSAEYRLRCMDGEYRWFSDRATMSEDSPQEQFGLLLDVSDRRVLEEQLAHAQKLEAIGELTGGVAHDFNNMLSVIMGSLERVLARPVDDAKTRSRLDLAMQAARSCADLTKRLLGFARRQPLDPRRIDVASELKRLHDMVRRLLGKAITVDIACQKGLWPVYVDSSQLEAAIINLIINARDAMPDGGTLRISARNLPHTDRAIWRLGLKSGNYVELAVADSGSGMPPEVKARAFEPFFTTKHPGKGTGLGLSTMYGFVQQSGGTASIESEVGAGTTVTLYLPRAPAAKVVAAPSRSPVPAADGLAGCHVLLVEDEARVRELTRSMLEEMGCKVSAAGTGDAALGLMETANDVALLFTDCMMPGTLDGAALALEARRRRPDLPVLFTSGIWAGVDRIGADTHNIAFLAKPYTAEQLRTAVRRLLSHSARPRGQKKGPGR